MLIIGEKINGSIPSVGAAIADKDESFIKNLAIKQAEAGASFIDVCASVAPDIEAEMLGWLMDIVQDAVDTPLCIDSPNPHVIEAVFGKANKPGLINSVSLEGDKLDVLFPLIAETEWSCVVLLCDNNGIPATADSRLSIADTIISRAVSDGIALERLYIDPLVTALSTDGASMTKFVSCCTELKRKYPAIHITSGLSNISYGMPLRTTVNQAFLSIAMSAGMDSAVMDPLNRNMMATLLATEALLENDRHCRTFNKAFRQGKIGPPKN